MGGGGCDVQLLSHYLSDSNPIVKWEVEGVMVDSLSQHIGNSNGNLKIGGGGCDDNSFLLTLSLMFDLKFKKIKKICILSP